MPSSNYWSDSNWENLISDQEGDCFRCNLGYRLFKGKCIKCEDSNCLACDYDISHAQVAMINII